jgi:hypothetical protein
MENLLIKKTVPSILIALLLSILSLCANSDFDVMMNAAKKGDHHAQFLIGFSYFTGKYRDGTPVEKNYDKALHWLQLSAQGGDTYAQFHLGGMYHQGIGVGKNDSTAAVWFLTSAQGGDSRARYNLALCYLTGAGISQDIEKAYAWASLAAAYGKMEDAENLVSAIIPKVKNPSRADSLVADYLITFGGGNADK